MLLMVIIRSKLLCFFMSASDCSVEFILRRGVVNFIQWINL